jgi:glucose/arabinose dehydrogenase
MPEQHHLVLSDRLPAPYATPAADNGANFVARSNRTFPRAPAGFSVRPYATGLSNPRFMALAPNGDIFVAESYANKITLLHDGHGSTYADGFHYPHGLAFHDNALYVGDLDAVWRIPYAPGLPVQRTRVTADSFGGRGIHITRDIAFAPDGALYVAIGSANNIAEEPVPRATVQLVEPGGHLQTFAGGMRNPVGMAFYPGTDRLFVTVCERDGLGDALAPDFLTDLHRGDFFGWPYAYAGPHPDPMLGARRPDLVARTRTPPVLFEAHSTPLGLVFYDGRQFPQRYRGDAFVALHGSWNTSKPVGYSVVRVHFRNGVAQPGYDDFVTGFLASRSTPPLAWGRPAGLLVDRDGSLLIADDLGKMIWRVSYRKPARRLSRAG